MPRGGAENQKAKSRVSRYSQTVHRDKATIARLSRIEDSERFSMVGGGGGAPPPPRLGASSSSGVPPSLGQAMSSVL